MEIAILNVCNLIHFCLDSISICEFDNAFFFFGKREIDNWVFFALALFSDIQEIKSYLKPHKKKKEALSFFWR